MYVAKFSSLALAQSFADRGTKAMMVILGDDSRFWVTTMAGAERLIRQGYEVAR